MPQYLNTDPEIMGGRPCFPGTRVEFSTLIDYLVKGYTFDEFMADFPSVNRNDAVAALKAATPLNGDADVSDNISDNIDHPLANESLNSAFQKIESQLAEWDNPKSSVMRSELDWLKESSLCDLLQEKLYSSSGEVITLMYLSEDDEAIEMEWRGKNNIFSVTVDLIQKKASWHNTDLNRQSAKDGNLPPLDTVEAIDEIRSLVRSTFGGR